MDCCCSDAKLDLRLEPSSKVETTTDTQKELKTEAAVTLESPLVQTLETTSDDNSEAKSATTKD